jgi:wyosine [tRNA(Phe)-imidazoG37] synthetase (radical SAM superfamily)
MSADIGKMAKKKNYFYGPVPSRRLGFSLGVDILPGKTCSFDCVYCQLGGGMRRRVRRFQWVDLFEFKKQLSALLKKNPRIDYITISGSGEPTLHKGLDKIIQTIKEASRDRYPVCVITNSSLLYRKDVRKELAAADLIIPSLDSATLKGFRRINRPHPAIDLKKIISGLIALRQEFKGKLYLEVMLAAGFNDSLAEARALKKVIAKILPDKVQLNLPLRPSFLKIRPPEASRLKAISALLSEIKGVEIVEDNYPKRKASVIIQDLSRRLLELVSVRPETAQAMAESLSVNTNEVSKCLQDLLKKNKVIMIKKSGKLYYANDPGKDKNHL